ncbi:pyridoxamine 5'-phosphate oxidase family protein [uncultured Sphingomonas sp.]|uniref:pyridoxamine 5'-phosphate oxidase family protein n=1 Tax=uncultured Sphingomonas sp. TaxID=158754 RepID=UPI0035CA0E93
MTGKTLSDIAEWMRDIDFCMLATHSRDGAIAARPMSNNREVTFGGDCWFFTWDESLMVDDIRDDPKVTMTFQGSAGLLGTRPTFFAVEGVADIVRDRTAFAEHWTDGLDRWFEQGIDTPGLAMIHVHATRIHYWDGEDEAEVPLGPRLSA